MAEFSNLGLLLKNQRIQKNLTQAELAAGIKVHSQFVSNWERGLCAPPSEKFQALINFLKIDRNKIVQAMLADAKMEIEEKVYKKGKNRALKKLSL